MDRCDFCGSERPAWRYPARSFFDAVGSQSKGDWLACQDCHMLIDAGELDHLTERCFRNVLAPAIPNGKAWSRLYIEHLHQLFWQHRTGRPYRMAS